MYLDAKFCMFCGNELIVDDLIEGCCTGCMEKASMLNMYKSKNKIRKGMKNEGDIE